MNVSVITAWEQLPLTMRMADVAALYGLSIKTIRRLVERADPSIPRPVFNRPYRWRRSDCQRHYETTTLSGLRRARAKDARLREVS